MSDPEPTVLFLCVPMLVACNESTSSESGRVDNVPVRENVCELVPAEIVSEWDLTEVSHSTDNDLISVGRCSMAAGDPSDVALSLRLTSYSGGDADSASRFAADDRAKTCSSLSATYSAAGTVADGQSSCEVVFSADGGASIISVFEVAEAQGVVRIEMRARESDAEAVEATVEDLTTALEAGFEDGGDKAGDT